MHWLYVALSLQPSNPKLGVVDLAAIQQLDSFALGTLTDKSDVPQLSSNSATILAQSMSTFERVVNRVIDGTITLADFALIQPYKAGCVELCNLSEQLQARNDDLQNALERRGNEHEAYTVFITEFSEFWQICKPSFEGK